MTLLYFASHTLNVPSWSYIENYLDCQMTPDANLILEPCWTPLCLSGPPVEGSHCYLEDNFGDGCRQDFVLHWLGSGNSSLYTIFDPEVQWQRPLSNHRLSFYRMNLGSSYLGSPNCTAILREEAFLDLNYTFWQFSLGKGPRKGR